MAETAPEAQQQVQIKLEPNAGQESPDQGRDGAEQTEQQAENLQESGPPHTEQAETLETRVKEEERCEEEQAQEDNAEKDNEQVRNEREEQEDDDDDDDDQDDEDEDEEDGIKVTIEDYTAEDKHADKQTIQKQPQQAKQAAPAILEANQHIVDISSLEDKPWRKPGADINDYFNYGFDETSWKQYCDHQKQMKNISNEIAEVRNETYRIPVVGHNDMVHKHNNHYNQIPVVPSVIQPVVMHPSRDQHMRDLSPMVEHQSHSRSRRHERQQHQISPPVHQQPSGGGGGRSGRDHRDVSSHRHSRSPHTKERERKHSSGRSRKGSKSRERRRSRSKEVSSKKRRSRSRERDDDRRSKRHKSSRRA